MKAYGAVAAVLGYWIVSGSALADDSYMVRAETMRPTCHVQRTDIVIDLTDLAGPFPSRAAACKAALDLYDADERDSNKCWRYGVITRGNCQADGVTLPTK